MKRARPALTRDELILIRRGLAREREPLARLAGGEEDRAAREIYLRELRILDDLQTRVGKAIDRA